jgi:hypothetical protein
LRIGEQPGARLTPKLGTECGDSANKGEYSHHFNLRTGLRRTAGTPCRKAPRVRGGGVECGVNVLVFPAKPAKL